MYRLILFLFIILSMDCSAQKTKIRKKAKKENLNNIFIEPIMPEFPFGEDSLINYFQKNLKYKEVIASQIEGTIIIKFIVKKNGKISNLKINKGFNNKFYDNQVIEIAKNMPRWKPARNFDGKPIDCTFELPIHIHFE